MKKLALGAALLGLGMTACKEKVGTEKATYVENKEINMHKQAVRTNGDTVNIMPHHLGQFLNHATGDTAVLDVYTNGNDTTFRVKKVITAKK